MKPALRWSCLVSLTVLLFFWKLVFTSQFSLLESRDAATQYAWNHYAASSLKQGVVPLWDPYSQSGRPFVGESPTGLFYPLKLLLYFAPFTDRGVLSPELYHGFHVLAHVLAGWFMLLLARELGLGWFAGYTSAICFALGGVVGKVSWPDYLDSAIWLPLLFLFLMRALRRGGRARIRDACLAGTALGLAVLAGRLHVAIMDALVVASAVLYAALALPETSSSGGAILSKLRSAAAVAMIVALVGTAIAAVQIFPSFEYGRRTVRYIGDGTIDALQKIPYSRMEPGLSPRAMLEFVIGVPDWNRSEVGPYLGVLPFLLALLGGWRFWQQPWVRYLAALSAAATYCSLGVHSFLHGLLYSTIPFVWIIREPERFLYLAHFALAVLAGFGIQALRQDHGSAFCRGAIRVFGWFVLAFAATLTISSIAGVPINDWYHVAFLAAASSYAALAWTVRRGVTPAASFALAVVILCDLHAFHWTITNRAEAARTATDIVEQLWRSRGAAEFLRTRPGPFRVHFDAPETPNIGDLYGIQTTTSGISAAELKTHHRVRNESPGAGLGLLNVRFLLRKEALDSRAPVFADENWKIYEVREYCPRAWLVHHVTVEPSLDGTIRRISEPAFRPRDEAFIDQPLEVALSPTGTDSEEQVQLVGYETHRIEVAARASATSLLVLSEVFYPGWSARVNGSAVRVHQVDGLLRGVVVPAGDSRVVFVYSPLSVLAGAIVSCCAMVVVLGSILIARAVPVPANSTLEADYEVPVT
jgi:hypothetical protein